MHWIKRTCAAVLAVALSACVTAPPLPGAPPAIAEEAHPVVLAYAAAYNAGDADAMGALMHPDFEWLQITSEGVETISAGREALLAEMRAAFAGGQTTTSSLSGWSIHGPYASVVETASWTGKDGSPRSQSSLSVYEITAEGLLRRVWYFPVVK